MLYCGMGSEKYNIREEIFKDSVDSEFGRSYQSLGSAYASTHGGTTMERIAMIREGLAYEVIEEVGNKGGLPIHRMLSYLGLAQTTYNKRKREKAKLSVRDAEIVMLLSELLDYGLMVFNNERDKFCDWLSTSSRSIGGSAPYDLFDTITGLNVVRGALDRIEYGTYA